MKTPLCMQLGSPEWTLNVAGQYNFTSFAPVQPFVRLEWTYRSKTASDIEAIATQLQPLDNAVTRERGLDTSVNGTGFINGVAVP